MKLSKEDLKKKIDEKISDDDLKIELLEDIEDSFETESETETVSKEDYEKVVSERDEIKKKYKERFLSNEETKEDEEKEDEETGLEEEKIVDIKEI